MNVYNSAYAEPPEFDPVDRVRVGQIEAFVADLNAGPRLPEAFGRCDVLYCEPPWKAEHAEKFSRRAGAAGAGWAFLRPLQEAVRQGVPLVAVAGVEFGRRMGSADARPIQLAVVTDKPKTVRARAYAWNRELPAARTSEDLLEALLGDPAVSVIGDPMCGFGKTGRFAVRFGKAAVLADVNASCIGYIAAMAPTWGFGLR